MEVKHPVEMQETVFLKRSVDVPTGVNDEHTETLAEDPPASAEDLPQQGKEATTGKDTTAHEGNVPNDTTRSERGVLI